METRTEWTWLTETRTVANVYGTGTICYTNVAAVRVLWFGDRGIACRCNPEVRTWQHASVNGQRLRWPPATAASAGRSEAA